jgi:glycosyltransferase involved in cell wall biosynthesis
MPELSVVMPSMNEEQTIKICIQKAQSVFDEYRIEGEIIVVDNSSDRTAEIASSMGANVIRSVKGYGKAYMTGLSYAKGEYIAIADADNTYDLLELPKFIDPLMRGDADFVIGTRLKGTIKKGAMPWLHQYIGNPFLTWLLKKLFNIPISDAHCGMRAFTKDALEKMNIKSHGMEMASEMIIEAADKGLKIKEVPITYHIRDAPSKLRSFQDGWRHIRFMMLYRPIPFLVTPGIIVFLLGILLTATIMLKGNIEENRLHSLILGSMLLLIGSQTITTGIYMKAYGFVHGMYKNDGGFIKKLLDYHSLERELVGGALIVATGTFIGFQVTSTWVRAGYGPMLEIGSAVLAMLFGAIGLQIIFTSIFLSVLMLDVDTDW